MARGKVAEPVVTVLSVNVLSALTVNVPVVVKEPVAGTVLQPRPKIDTSIAPDSVRQDDSTFQAPTALPPQGESAVQLEPAPAPPPFSPPVLLPPALELPPPADAPAAPLGALVLLHPMPAVIVASTNMPESPN
ncbi:MAG: hypothetical protein ABI488_24745 [Polyangiaceae bacterium]